MKRTITVMVFCLALCVSVLAQTPKPVPAPTKPAVPATPALPTIDQILDKYVEALGGKAAISKPTTRTLKGTVEIPAANLNGTLEGYEKAPNKSLAIITLTGFGQMQQGYDGHLGWAQDPQQGLRELKDPELASVVRDADFYRNIKLKEQYPKMTLKGKEKTGDREAYVIEATPASGSPEKLYFDTETGLLIRLDVERDTPQGKVAVTSEFEDYKVVDGIKIPFTVRQVLPSITLVFRIAEVKHNEPIDDARFVKPVEKPVEKAAP